MSAVELNLEAQMRRTIERLTEEFAGVFGPETVERFAKTSFAKLLENAMLTTFLPVMTERFARDRLRALAQADGLAPKERPEVLYVCVHNAGRSQMAALLTAHLSGGRVNVRSAGSDPADSVNPLVVEAMAELGLDMSAEFPKPLTDEVVRAADAVITMGCGDACPLYPGQALRGLGPGGPGRGRELRAGARDPRGDPRARHPAAQPAGDRGGSHPGRRCPSLRPPLYRGRRSPRVVNKPVRTLGPGCDSRSGWTGRWRSVPIAVTPEPAMSGHRELAHHRAASGRRLLDLTRTAGVRPETPCVGRSGRDPV